MSWGKAWVAARVAVLLLGGLFMAHLALDSTPKLIAYQGWGIDFLPMWAAAREAFGHPGRVYDFVGLTRFEHPWLGHFRGLRPFVYPPPALMAFLPFSLAPFSLANAVWTLGGVAAIVGVLWQRLTSLRSLILIVMLLTPAAVLVVAAGQVTFYIAALTVAGIYALKEKPELAGVLFGIAGAMKPQALVLVPVALLALGAWRALGAAAIAAVLAALASAILFGADMWIAWLAAVPRFQHLVMTTPGLERGMITPTALGITLNLGESRLALWRAAFGLGAAAMVWWVFRTTEDPARRIAALLGGGLFITPYAMHYDATLVAPAAVLMLSQRTQVGPWLAAAAGGAALACAAIPHWGALGLTAFVIWAALVPETAFARRLEFAGVAPEPQEGAAT